MTVIIVIASNVRDHYTLKVPETVIGYVCGWELHMQFLQFFLIQGHEEVEVIA